jgi:hypothetical protein
MNLKSFKSIFLTSGLLLVFCWFGHSVAQEGLLFDLKAVADRSAPEVEKILGKPSKWWMTFLEVHEAVLIRRYGAPI